MTRVSFSSVIRTPTHSVGFGANHHCYTTTATAYGLTARPAQLHPIYRKRRVQQLSQFLYWGFVLAVGHCNECPKSHSGDGACECWHLCNPDENLHQINGSPMISSSLIPIFSLALRTHHQDTSSTCTP